MALPTLSLLPSRLSRTSWCHSQGRAAKALSVYHQKNYGGHSYGCLMALLPEEARKEITDWCLENIAAFHLAPEGRELTPHVTIKYGFTDDNDTTVATLQAITQASGPIYLTIQGLRTFPEGDKGVPLVLDVDSPQLHALNSHISEVVECVDKFPDYIPHITLAYLTQEAAGLYLEESPPFVGKSVVCDTVEWTGSDDRRVSFSLGVFTLRSSGQKSAPPQANKDTKVATGSNTKASGTRKDSLGRERCYQDGVMVPCNKPEEGGHQEQGQANPEDPELAKQDSQGLDASSQEAPAAAETPEEKAKFNAEWDKAIQDQLPDIQASNVIDHDYSPEEVAAEQNWHAEFIEWKHGLGGSDLHIEPADASKVARFVSGLLNPLIGGVDYIVNLLDKWLGGSPKESQVDPAIGDELQAYFDQLSPNNEANKPAAQLIAQVVGEQVLPVVKAMAGGGLEEGHRNRWVNTQLAKPSKAKETQLARTPEKDSATPGQAKKTQLAPQDEVETKEPAKDAKPEEKADTYYQGLMSNLASHGITPEKHDPRIDFEELKSKVAGLVKAGLDHDDILEAVQKFADRSIGLSSPGGKGAKKKGPSLKPSRIKAPTAEERAAAGKATTPAKAGAQARVGKAKAKVQGAERNRAAMTAEERQAKQEETAEKNKQKGSKRKAKSAKYWAGKYKNELRSTERELKDAKRAGDEKETARLERILDRRVSEIQDEFKREGYGEFTYQPKKKSLAWYSTKDLTIHDPIKVHLPDLEQQKDWSCGACAMRIVCSYFGVGPEEEKDFRQLLGTSSKEGTHVAKMVAFAKQQGLKVQAEEGLTIQDLKAALDDGKPVIVLLQAWGYPEDYPEDGSGHYAIVIGYDDECIYFEDPWIKGRRAKLKTAEFENRWHDTGSDEKDTGHKFVRWGMICYKPQKIEYLKGFTSYQTKDAGRWVTTEEGQHIWVSGAGEIKPSGPSKAEEKKPKAKLKPSKLPSPKAKQPQKKEPKTSSTPDYVGKPITDTLAKSKKVFDAPAYQQALQKIAANSDMRETVEDYTLEGYKSLNSKMRSCPPDFSCLSGKDKEMYEVLEYTLDRLPPLKEPIKVFRGLELNPELTKSLVDAAKSIMEAGGDFSMPSITSTSISSDIGGGFGSSVVFHIMAKKGLYAESMTINTGEEELIQSSKTKYKVVGVTPGKGVMPGAHGENSQVIYLEEV